jgi:pyruvate dehydrogenase E1 component alpha subunit
MMKQTRRVDAGEISDISPQVLKSLYTGMLRLRKFEEKTAELLGPGTEIKCPVHLYTGEEAVAVGVCANLRKDDYVFSTHRSHGHYLAKGGSTAALMAEIYGRTTGCSKGRGGSMHLSAPELGLLGSTAIVAGSIPLAVGAALAFSIQGADNVSTVFFGDGAVNEGVWHESMNLSALKKLPVIFVCENNLYSTHMPIADCLAGTDIYKKAASFNMPGVRIDGNDVIEVYRTAQTAVANARAGKGPTLIECITYRWRGHVGPNYDLDKGLRSQAEFDSWMKRCPIDRFEEKLLAGGILTEADKVHIHKDLDGEIESAIAFAKESPYPNKKDLLNYVFK